MKQNYYLSYFGILSMSSLSTYEEEKTNTVIHSALSSILAHHEAYKLGISIPTMSKHRRFSRQDENENERIIRQQS